MNYSSLFFVGLDDLSSDQSGSEVWLNLLLVYIFAFYLTLLLLQSFLNPYFEEHCKVIFPVIIVLP